MPVATRKPSRESRVQELPADPELEPGWRVILFNCECHTFEEVEAVLIKAARCSLSQARAFSWEIHSKGSAAVYHGELEHCEAVADAIGAVGLLVKVAR